MLMGITSSLCVVLLPRLSNLVVENEREEFERLLIPKIRIEVLSDDADAETLVGVIVKSAGSGTIGDGKVWVAPLDSVTRVRTGETGSAAI